MCEEEFISDMKYKLRYGPDDVYQLHADIVRRKLREDYNVKTSGTIRKMTEGDEMFRFVSSIDHPYKLFLRNVLLTPTFNSLRFYAMIDIIPLTRSMMNVVDIHLLKRLMKSMSMKQLYKTTLWCIHFHYLARHVDDRVYEFSEKLFDDEEHALASYYAELTGESASFNKSPRFIYDEHEVIVEIEDRVYDWLHDSEET